MKIIKLDDPAFIHIDPIMSRDMNGATMETLFGGSANKITVEQLIAMQAGL